MSGDDAKWYAVQTKPFGESWVDRYFTRLGIRTFLPQTKQEQNVCGTDRSLARPLFNGYLFARFSLGESYDAIRYAPRVLRVLGSSTLPLPVPDEIIHSIQARVQEDGFVRLLRSEAKSGDQVVLEQGRFSGWMGRVERECDDHKRVLILLESLHQSWLVVERRFVSVVAASA